MRRLLILLALLLPAQGWAQMAAVSSSSTNTSSNLFAGTSTYNYAFGGNTLGSGRLVVLNVGTFIRQVSSISGTNLTMARLVQSSYNAANMIGDLWYGITTGSVSSVTITLSGNTSDNACVSYVELSGQQADQSTATSNNAIVDNLTAHNSGSVTPPTATNTVVAAMYRTAATWTDDATFTMGSSANAECALGYVTQTSATAQEFNATSDVNRYSVLTIGAFLGTAGGGGGGSTTTAPNFFRGRLRVNP